MKTNISGTYELSKYGYEYKTTKKFKPISDFYKGTIHYDNSGFMSVTLRFAETATELSDLVAYCGTYEVEENKIHHQVTMSVKPGYEGQLLTRVFKLENGALELEFENTDEFRKFAVWIRK